jgi:lipoprotein-releasing system ATP-binding protein
MVGEKYPAPLIGILDIPAEETITIDGQVVTGMSEADRSRARNRLLGFIYQYHHLLPGFTALENVMTPMLIAGIIRNEAEKKAAGFLTEIGLSARLHHSSKQLSGGQNQRVAVALAAKTDRIVRIVAGYIVDS